MNIDKEKLVKYIKRLSEVKILVVGDLAMDEMVYGDAERISREAPVLILQHTHTKPILGGASNAAHNVATLNNGKVSVTGVFGEDYQADQLEQAFKDANISTEYVIRDKSRKTITKTRILGSITTSITQQIVRIDRQTNAPLCAETEEKLIKNIEKAIKVFDKLSMDITKYHGTKPKDGLTGDEVDEQIKAVNFISDLAKDASNTITICFGGIVQARKDFNRQAKAICVKALSYKHEAAMVSESSYSDDIFAGVVIR